MLDPLLYGKAGVIRLTSIEQKDDNTLELFQLGVDGETTSILKPFKYWVLSPEQEGPNWVRLKGNLHFKWGRQLNSKRDFYSCRSSLKDKCFSVFDGKESAMLKDGYTSFLDLKPSDVPILSFDLETTGIDPAAPGAKILLISNTFRKNGKIIKRLFSYDEYESQGDMLLHWADWVSDMDPSFIVGHNIFGFDFNYILHIADQERIELPMGRNGSPLRQENYESKYRVDGSRELSYKKIRCYGRELVDTLFLSYRYDVATKKYDSYGLKAIIKAEGLEKSDRVFYDASQIRFNYEKKEEWEKIKTYCEDDSDDGLALFDLMCPAYFYLSQSVPRGFQQITESATGAQINGMMIRAYLQDMHSLPKASESLPYEGAISLGNPGIYDNVHKVDVASLYPSIMIQYEVFDKEKDPKEYFKKLVRTFTDMRLEYKKKAKLDKYYDDLQASTKIFVNSAYGFLATGGLLFNSPVKAAFITKTGREILTKCMDWAISTNKLIVNADTDSISYCREDMTYISKEDRTLYMKEINSMYPERISWEDDGYFKKFCVLKAKNYIMQKEDGTVKIKGAAIKATTKEPALREFINGLVQYILDDKEEFTDLYNNYVKEILHVEDISRWCSKKSITSNVLNPKRKQEQNVFDLLEGTELVEGDKCHVYFVEDGSLQIREKFNHDHDKNRLFKKLHDTAKVFDSVLCTEDLFINYSLKRSQKLLGAFNVS